MRDTGDGGPASRLVGEDLPGSGAACRIESGRWFVEQENVRLPRDSLREQCPLSLTTREGIEGPVGKVKKFHSGKRVLHPPAAFLPPRTGRASGMSRPRPHRGDLAHRERKRVGGCGALHDEREILGALHHTGCRPPHASKNLNQGRFPRTVRTSDSRHLTPLDIDIDVLEHRGRTKRETEVPSAYRGGL